MGIAAIVPIELECNIQGTITRCKSHGDDAATGGFMYLAVRDLLD